MNRVCFRTDRQSCMYPKIFRKITIIRRNIPPKKSTFVLSTSTAANTSTVFDYNLFPNIQSTHTHHIYI